MAEQIKVALFALPALTWKAACIRKSPVLESPSDGLPAYPEPARQVGNEETLAVPFDPLVSSGVASLFCLGGPPAISRLVISVIVDPFKGVLRSWRGTKIFVKRSEAGPCVVEGYSSAAVILEGWVAWIRAALFHVLPSAPFFRLVKSVPFVVSSHD